MCSRGRWLEMAMDAPEVLVRAAYGPDTLAAMLKAFQDAWEQIEPHFYDCSISIEDARQALADEILAAARENSRNSEELKNLGLQGMALRYQLERSLKGMEGAIGQRVYNAKYWKSNADKARAMAERMTNLEFKRLLIGIAENYAQLARCAQVAEATGGDKMGGPRKL
jgi:hypothetical protein